MPKLPRRAFLVGVPAACVGAAVRGRDEGAGDGSATDAAAVSAPIPAGFPRQDPELVRRIVGVSHFDLDAVRELVTARPALAKASWDWGFGDWESALGAASHVGRPDIAEVLIAHGARPNLFTFAMLDRIDAVRAIVETSPGIQRIRGPHGITLLAHARAGDGERVVEYLEGVEGADDADETFDVDAARAYFGTYAYGETPAETFTVLELRGALGIRPGEDATRRLVPVGVHTFHPAGAPAVRIVFRIGGSGAVEALTVLDGDLIVTARRIESSGADER